MNAAFLNWTDDAETNFAEAYDLAQRAVALDPRYPNAHYALGCVCMWTRRSDRGIEAFEEAIKLNPSFVLDPADVDHILDGLRKAGFEQGLEILLPPGIAWLAAFR